MLLVQIKKQILDVLVGGVLYFSCSQENNTLVEDGISRINFSDLKVGQQSEYVKYLPECNDPMSIDNVLAQLSDLGGETMSITPDTLILKIESKTDNTFTFSEEVISASLEANSNKKVYYDVIKESDYVLIPQRSESELFWFYANDTIRLKPKEKINLVQKECFIEHNDAIFRGNAIGNIEQFDLDSYSIENKNVVSCVPELDPKINAYLIYDVNELHVSHQIFWPPFFDATPLVLGWHRLSNK